MAARSKDYWAARAVQREHEDYLKGSELSTKLFSEYERAARMLRKDINDFYGKYATRHGLTYEQAVRTLTHREAREWKAALGEYVAQISAEADPKVRAAMVAQLDALSANSQISRLEALLGQTQLTLNEMYDRCVSELRAEFGDIYEAGYYRKHYDLQSRSGWLNEVAKLDAGLVESAVNYPWSGAMFSDRLWRNKDALLFNVREILTQGLIQGKSLPETAKALSTKLGQSYKAAERLVRTETSHLHNEADKAAYLAAGVDEYEFVATLDARTCEVCGALDGKHFKLKVARPGENCPPMHPNDRCTTVEYDPEDKADWAASGERMPESMTYEEWLGSRRPPAADADGSAGEAIGSGRVSSGLTYKETEHSFTGSGKPSKAKLYDDGRVKVYVPDEAELAKLPATPDDIFDAAQELPDGMTAFVDGIELLDTPNPLDSFWEKEYNIPGFKSAATGGSGVITFYQGDGGKTRGELVRQLMHETAHVVDQTYSGGKLSASSWYLDAVAADDLLSGGAFSSEYAKKAFMGSGAYQEDFADGMAYFLAAKEKFEKRFPNRSALYREVLKWKKE